MRIIVNTLLIILFFNLWIVNSQSLNNQKINAPSKFVDTVKSKSIFKKSIIPVCLIGLGVFVNKSHFGKDLFEQIFVDGIHLVTKIRKK